MTPAETCGTTVGYFGHLKRAEPTCEECRAAQRNYMREYRERTGGVHDKQYRDAKRRALANLAKLHPEEYKRLYRAELEYREEGTEDE